MTVLAGWQLAAAAGHGGWRSTGRAAWRQARTASSGGARSPVPDGADGEDGVQARVELAQLLQRALQRAVFTITTM